MRVTILGSGTSHGVPMVGCSCRVCTSRDPKNNRTRCSLLLEFADQTILIDTSTDFRLQALRAGIKKLDAVLYTHSHADHLHGLDDTRSLSWSGAIPLFAAPNTAAEIRERFSYVFNHNHIGGAKPKVRIVEIVEKELRFGDSMLYPVPIKHGDLDIYGYRIGDFAYLTDCSYIPESSYDLLAGTEVLVIGALRHTPHPTHFSVDQALEAAETIGAGQVYLTHICHELEHRELERELPAHVRPAYDGLCIEIVG